MPGPLRVYLDSQDFSHLSPIHSKADEYLPTKEALLELRTRGVAQFVFSDIHIFECLSETQERAPEGMARIKAILDLCGKHNLPNSGSIIEYEIKKLAAVKGYYHEPIVLTKDWFPDFPAPTDLLDLSAAMKEQAEKLPNSTRSQRRFATKMMRKELRNRINGKKFQAALKELTVTYPIRPSDSDRIMRVFEGKADEEELVNIIKDGLRDVGLFCKWTVANWDEGNPLIRTLRDVGSDFHSSLLNLYDDTRTFHAHAKETGFNKNSDAMVAEQFRSTRDEMFYNIAQSLAKELLNINVPEKALHINPGDTPSLYSLFEYLSLVMRQSTPEQRARNPHNKRSSDYVDGLHALFLPLADIFRADNQSQAQLRKIGKSQAAKLAPSLKDLPSFIENMAANRG
ncbi:hypothetical protein [Dyella psychrodurans]|uniref:Uncharacterized protein n=1 Tax=Dyella psychrodurans TaxID=1927960 RepID=A0A370X2H3_9GAMM|nr:hypothetical protein [Dyella psychrodurans]RDS82599.1 hypothetical protein DWU99_14460 [Dyella psychrodurans]